MSDVTSISSFSSSSSSSVDDINALNNSEGVQGSQQTEESQAIVKLTQEGVMVAEDMQTVDSSNEAQSPTEASQNEVLAQVMEQNKSNFELVAETAYGAMSSSSQEPGVTKIKELESGLFKAEASHDGAKTYLQSFNNDQTKLFDAEASSKTYQSQRANELNQYLQAYATVAKNEDSNDTNNVAVYKSTALIGICADRFPATEDPKDNPVTCLANDLVNLTSSISTEDVTQEKTTISNHLHHLEEMAISPEQQEIVSVLTDYFNKLIQAKLEVAAIVDGSAPQFSLDTHHEQPDLQLEIHNNLGENSGIPSNGVPEDTLLTNRVDESNLQAIQNDATNGDVESATERTRQLKDPSARDVAMGLIGKYVSARAASLIKDTAASISEKSEQNISGMKFLGQLQELLEQSKKADDPSSGVSKPQVLDTLKSILGVDDSTENLATALVDKFKDILGLHKAPSEANSTAAQNATPNTAPNTEGTSNSGSTATPNATPNAAPKTDAELYEDAIVDSFKALVDSLLSPSANATESENATPSASSSEGAAQSGSASVSNNESASQSRSTNATEGAGAAQNNGGARPAADSLEQKVLNLLQRLLNVTDANIVQHESFRQKSITLSSEFKLMSLLTASSLLLSNDQVEVSDVLPGLKEVQSLPWHQSLNENSGDKAAAAETKEQLSKLIETIDSQLESQKENEEEAEKAPENSDEAKAKQEAALENAKAAREATLKAFNLLKADLNRTFGITESENLLEQKELNTKPYSAEQLVKANELLNCLSADSIGKDDLYRILTAVADGIADGSPVEFNNQLKDKLNELNAAENEAQARTAFNDARRALSLYTAQGADKFKELANKICPKQPASSEPAAVAQASGESIAEFSKQLLKSDGRDLAQSLNALVHSDGETGRSVIDSQTQAVVNAMTLELNKPHRYSSLEENRAAYNVFRNLGNTTQMLMSLNDSRLFKEAGLSDSRILDTSALSEQIENPEYADIKDKLEQAKEQIEATKNAMTQFKRTGKTSDFLKFMKCVHQLESDSLNLAYAATKDKALSDNSLEQEQLAALDQDYKETVGSLSLLKSNESNLIKFAYNNFCAEHSYSESLSSKTNNEVHDAFLKEIDEISAGNENDEFANGLKKAFNDRNLNLSGLDKNLNLGAMNMVALNLSQKPKENHIQKAGAFLSFPIRTELGRGEQIRGLDSLHKFFSERFRAFPTFEEGINNLSFMYNEKTASARAAEIVQQSLGLSAEDLKKFIPGYRNPKVGSDYNIGFSSNWQKGEASSFALLGLTSSLVQSPEEMPDSFLQNVAKIPRQDGESIVETAPFKRPLTYEQLQSGFTNLAFRPSSKFEARLFLEKGYEVWRHNQTEQSWPEKYTDLTPEQSRQFVSEFTNVVDDSALPGKSKFLDYSDFFITPESNRSARFSKSSYAEQKDVLTRLSKRLVDGNLLQEGDSWKKRRATKKLVEKGIKDLQSDLDQLIKLEQDGKTDISEYKQLQESKTSKQRDLLAILYGKDCRRLEAARYAIQTAPIKNNSRADHMEHIACALFGKASIFSKKSITYKEPTKKLVPANSNPSYASFGSNGTNEGRLIEVLEYPEPETGPEKLMASMRELYLNSSVNYKDDSKATRATVKNMVNNMMFRGTGVGPQLTFAVCAAVEETMAELGIDSYDELQNALLDSSKNEQVQEALNRSLAHYFDPSIKRYTEAHAPGAGNDAALDLKNKHYQAAQTVFQALDLGHRMGLFNFARYTFNVSLEVSAHCDNFVENINALFDPNQKLKDSVARHGQIRQQTIYSSVESLLQSMPPNSVLETDANGKVSVKFFNLKQPNIVDGVVTSKFKAQASVDAEYGRNLSVRKNPDGSFDILTGNKADIGVSASLDASIGIGYRDKKNDNKNTDGTSSPKNISNVDVFSLSSKGIVGANLGGKLTQKLHCSTQTNAVMLLAKMQTGSLTQDDITNLTSGKGGFFEAHLGLNSFFSVNPQDSIMDGFSKIPKLGEFKQNVGKFAESKGKLVGGLFKIADDNAKRVMRSSVNTVVGLPMSALASAVKGTKFKEEYKHSSNETVNTVTDNRSLGEKIGNAMTNTAGSLTTDTLVPVVGQTMGDKLAWTFNDAVTNASDADKAQHEKDQAEYDDDTSSVNTIIQDKVGLKRSGAEIKFSGKTGGNVKVAYSVENDNVSVKETYNFKYQLEVEASGRNPLGETQSNLISRTNGLKIDEVGQMGLKASIGIDGKLFVNRNRYCDPAQNNAINKLSMELNYSVDTRLGLYECLVKNNLPKASAKQIAEAVSDKDYPLTISLSMDWNSNNPSLPCGSDDVSFVQKINLANYAPVNIALSHAETTTTSSSFGLGIVETSRSSSSIKQAYIGASDWGKKDAVKRFIDTFKHQDSGSVTSEVSRQEDDIARVG